MGLALSTTLGVAVAQQVDETNSAASAGVAGSGGAAGGATGGAIGASRPTPTTTPERIADASRIVTHAQSLRTTINTRVEAASRRSDIVMVDCLTPLLTQLEASLAGAEQRLRALRLLAQGGDEAAVGHEYTMVSVLEPRFQLIEADMNQCLGDADITTGEDRITVDVSITLPDEDPAAPLDQAPVPVVPFIPPPLSPAL